MDWSGLAIQALSKLPTSSFAQMLREARTRGNLREDLKAIRDLMDMGLMPAEYRGAAMDVRFADDVDSATTGETVRLTTNLLRILDKAKSVETASELTPPSDEFMYRWVNDACNESDETLQEMWARVLTGEMARPGAISRHTHSVVRELTPDVAETFRTLCSYAMCSMDGAPADDYVRDLQGSYAPSAHLDTLRPRQVTRPERPESSDTTTGSPSAPSCKR